MHVSHLPVHRIFDLLSSIPGPLGIHLTLVLGTVETVSSHSIFCYRSTLYVIKGRTLDKELDNWLDKVGKSEEPYPIKGCKAVIAPFVINSVLSC